MTAQIIHYSIYHVLGRMDTLAAKMLARAIRHDDADLFSDAAKLGELMDEAQTALRAERKQQLEKDLEASVQLLRKTPVNTNAG